MSSTHVLSILIAFSWLTMRPLLSEEVFKSDSIKKEIEVPINAEKIAFVFVPPNSFTMGGEALHPGYEDGEGPTRIVEIGMGFYMSKYEISQSQWKAVMGYNPSKFVGDRRPVETVSWHEADNFCKNVQKAIGGIVRLPTEAEWEYACRAETKTLFHFGDVIREEDANYNASWTVVGDSSKSISHRKAETVNVGSFKPNGFGLYDMHGNVAEWCSDFYEKGYYSKAPRVSPVGPKDGEFKVVRGGSWLDLPWVCRSSSRFHNFPTVSESLIGFRIVYEPKP